MMTPLRQICVIQGVGFIIEYRVTEDGYDRLPNGQLGYFARSPGDAWDVVRFGNGETLWRRFVPWVGSLSRIKRA